MGIITQHTIPAATKVCAHNYTIQRAVYKISEARELALAHTQDLFMDSAPQIKVQPVLRAMGLAHGSPCPCSRTCRTGLEGTATDPAPWSKPFCTGRERRGPAPRNCQHWHSRVSLFRWVPSGSSRICKEVLMSFASPAESRGSQWTSKAGQWY